MVTKRMKKICIYIWLGFVSLIVLAVTCAPKSPPESPQQSLQESVEGACDRYIKENLRYPNISIRNEIFQKINDHTYAITVPVLATNIYGTQVQTIQMCTVIDGGDTWLLKSIVQVG